MFASINAAHHVDAVIHFAGIAYVAESYSDPTLYYRNVTANTANLVAGGILDIIGLTLTQGEEVLKTRAVSNLRYNIAQAREACTAVLLNLALSPHSVDAVLAHEGVTAGIVTAAADAENLTERAKKRLEKIHRHREKVGQ